MSQTRDVGDRMNIGYEARNPDTGALMAATVALLVTDPAGATSSPSITTPTLGKYIASFDLASAGQWRWKWTISGTLVDVAYGDVLAATVGPSTYITLPTLRLALGVAGGDRDTLIQMALSSAARGVDAYASRPPGGFALASATSARQFDASQIWWDSATGRYRLTVDEIGSITGLVVETGNGTTWTAFTGYRVNPLNALADSRPITGLTATSWSGSDLVRVTARWGWPSVPDQVAQATLITATRLYRRKDSPEGFAGGTPEFGGVRLAKIDPDVQTLLAPFIPPGVA